MTGIISKTIHMFVTELWPFFATLAFQPQVSNISIALSCSLVDNSAMLYVFWFGHSAYIEMLVFSKISIKRTKYTCR